MLELNYRDTRPVCERLKDQIRRLIQTGAYEEGEAFPGVREMASSLAINPRTVARAYSRLEEEGYLAETGKKGSYVVPVAHAEELRVAELLEEFDRLTGELLSLAVSSEELISHVGAIRAEGRSI